ncbi:TVP38/TMEM64 family protein [Glaciecola sp. 1036]|uniref:TVP38/TMEM64 family protein n=1 Tax=Alteromonadaceae TaxID=72275 RepID=UPI003CFDD24E
MMTFNLNRNTTKVLLKSLVLLILAVGASEIAQAVPSFDAFNQNWIDAHTRDNGVQGIVLFTLIAALLSGLGIPRQIVAFLAGYAFGFMEGMLFSTIAVTLSCLFVVVFSRFYARPIVCKFFNQKICKLDSFFSQGPFLKTIIIRLLPVGNNLATNLIAGVTKINIGTFVSGSFIGYLPQMAVFALMGKGVIIQSTFKISLSAVLLAVSGMLGVYLFKQYKADKRLSALSKNDIGYSAK